MANLNKVMLIGRLTRDPEAIPGGKGAKFGFAVNNRKLNNETQQWEDIPVFIDMEIWNRGDLGKPQPPPPLGAPDSLFSPLLYSLQRAPSPAAAGEVSRTA